MKLRTLILGLALSLPIHALAEQEAGPLSGVICSERVVMRDRLELQFGSTRVWQGIRGPEQMMELWEDDQGDWVLAIAHATGQLCIVAMGSGLNGFIQAEHM